MPNYITNTLTIEGENAGQVLIALCNAEGKFDFRVAAPYPESIYQGNLNQEDREIYGERNWYDWNIMNWGTKWNASNVDVDLNLSKVTFSTPWSAPYSYYYTMTKKYPDHKFHITWYDEDIGQNLGKIVMQNSKIIEENIPLGGSNKAFELLLELNPGARELFTLEDGVYNYK